MLRVCYWLGCIQRGTGSGPVDSRARIESELVVTRWPTIGNDSRRSMKSSCA